MIDWRSSMEQTYEFYVVDTATWKDDRKLDNVISCTINRDSSDATLGHATIDCAEPMGECYIRIYLIATQIQNGKEFRDKVPLGTFLVQTPNEDFNGKTTSVSMDAYTPLIELKNLNPPIGYSILKNDTIMDTASTLCRENLRAPVVKTSSDKTLLDNFVANLNDNWLTFLSDFIANAKYKFGLDEMSRVIFEPVQDTRSLRPVWTYDDSNSSILYPDLGHKRDLYGVPNVVEVVYSTNAGYRYSRVVNDDPNSPISTVNRGREVVYREPNPSFTGIPSQREIDEYATQLLRNLSSLEHTITYTHGYCPVRIGDCVMLDHKSAGLVNIKAKVISQSIKCETGCPVSETAVYTTKLWG